MEKYKTSKPKSYGTIILVSIGLIILSIAGYLTNDWKNKEMEKEHQQNYGTPLSTEQISSAPAQTSPKPAINPDYNDSQLDIEEKTINSKLQKLNTDINNITKSVNDYQR